MSRLAKVLPFVTPEEEGLESCSRPGFTLTTRSRFEDAEREEALQRELDEAPTPDEQERILNALDALRAEQEEDARREAEAEDARRDERDSRW